MRDAIRVGAFLLLPVLLRVVANDWSGDGGRGFQCCWSNAQVKVTVKSGDGSH